MEPAGDREHPGAADCRAAAWSRARGLCRLQEVAQPDVGPGEGNRTARVFEAEGRARAIDQVFQAVHRKDPDPGLLAYEYLQTLPQLAQGAGNSFFVIPGEVTAALQGVSRAFTETQPRSPATRDAVASGPDQQAAQEAERAASAAVRAASAAASDVTGAVAGVAQR